jgi:hypothetical protein
MKTTKRKGISAAAFMAGFSSAGRDFAPQTDAYQPHFTECYAANVYAQERYNGRPLGSLSASIQADLCAEVRSLPKCKFCGSHAFDLNQWGNCGMCVRGMERTNGD